MSQFTLTWDNTRVLSNPNATVQRASYRGKTAGGSFVTAGFTPPNDLDKTVITADTPNTLSDNIVYEFKIEAICTLNGPTINDNGIQEEISFACIVPTLTKTNVSGTISIDVTGLDILKARLVLRAASDNHLVNSIVINRVVNTISLTVGTLLSSTGYYWQVELFTTVNNVEASSASLKYLGTICSPYPFTTDDPPFCDPVTAVTVTSIEIP